MALFHVLRWTDDNGYQPVMVDEAEKLYPYTVSARSKIFVCGICGQGVTFTSGSVLVRHFRHSKEEQNKECEERSQTYGYNQYLYSLPSKIQTLPLRLTKNWKIEIGLLALHDSWLTKYDNKLLCIENER